MSGSITPFITLIIMFVIFYFLLIRPQQKRQKQVRNMQSELAKGDAVITIGGLHGTIHSIDENSVVVLANETTKLTYDRNSIRESKSI